VVFLVSMTIKDITYKTSAKKRAKPIKEAFQELAKEFAKQKEGNKKILEEFLELKLNSLLYEGKMSSDSLINLFVLYFDIDPNDIIKNINNITQNLRKTKPLRPSDKLWFELDNTLNEEEKFYLASLAKCHAKLKNKLKCK